MNNLLDDVDDETMKELLASSSEESSDSIDDSDESIDQEINDSEEFAQQVVQPLPQDIVSRKPAEASLTQSIAGQKSQPNILDQMSKLEQLMLERRKMQDRLALQAGANKIGQSLAGRYSGNFKPDNQVIDTLNKQAGQPTEDYINLLKTYKSMMPKEIGKKYQLTSVVDPKTGEVKQAVFDTQTGQVQGTDQLRGFATQVRVNPQTGELLAIQPALPSINQAVTKPQEAPKDTEKVIDIDKSVLNVNQRKALDDARADYLKESQKQREAYDAANRAKTLLNAGTAMGGDIVRAIQNMLARSTGEVGVMTENDVAPFGGRASVLDRLQRAATVAVKGELPKEDIKFLEKFADVMEQSAKRNVDSKSNFFVNNLYNDLKSSEQLKDVNFNKDSVKKLIGVEGIFNSQQPNISAGPYGDEVERGGKLYKWNATKGKYQLKGE